MRRLIVLLLPAIVIAGLTGCGGGDDDALPVCSPSALSTPAVARVLTDGVLTSLTLTATLTAEGRPLAGDTVQLSLLGAPTDGREQVLYSYDGVTDRAGRVSLDTTRGLADQVKDATDALTYRAEFQGAYATAGPSYCGTTSTGTITG